MDNQKPNTNTLWYGEIEDVKDPQMRGRLRVRINGYHSPDKTLLSVYDLPWAECAVSVTASKGSLDVRPGDNVIGFFKDGNNAQQPIVIGVMHKIVFSDKILNLSNTDETFPRSAKEVIITTKDEPSISKIARGELEGTTINIANNNRVHVCDISQSMRRAAAWVRLKFSEFMDLIRSGIRALLATLGISPDGASARFVELAKNIVRELKWIQEKLKDINDAIEIFQEYVKRVTEVIKWILSLPAKLLALFRDCLSELQKSLSKSFSDLFTSEGGTSDFSAITEVAKELSKTVSAAVETTGKAAEAAAATAAAVTTVTVAVSNVKKLRI